MGRHHRMHWRHRGRRVHVGCGLALLLLAATLTACGGSTASHAGQRHAASSPLLRTVHLPQYPFAVVDDPRTQRVFVFNGRDANAAGIYDDALHMSSVSVLDAATGRLLHTVPAQGTLLLERQAQEAAIDPQTGRVWLLMSRPDGTRIIAILDGHSGRHVRTLAVGGNALTLALDSQMQRLFVADATQTRLFALTTGRLLRVVRGGGPLFQVVVDARRDRAYLLSGYEEVILNERTGTVLATAAVPTRGEEAAYAFAVDARIGRVLVYLYDFRLRSQRLVVVDLTTGRVLHSINQIGGMPIVADPITGHAFVFDISTASDPAPIAAYMIAMRNGRLLRSGTVAKGIDSLDLTGSYATEGSAAVDAHAGRAIFVTADAAPGPSAGVVSVFDTRTGRQRRTIFVGHGTWEAHPSVAVDESAGRVFVVNTDDKTISVLDAARL